MLPGLVNAHTHLELSYLRDEVPPASEFVTWIRGVMAARRQPPDPKRAGDSRRRSTAAIAEAVALRHGDRRRHQQHAGDVRAARAQPARRRRVLRADSVQRRRTPTAFVDEARRAARRAGADRTRPRRAWPRTRRIRWRRWCFARSAAAIDRDPFAPCSVHLSESVGGGRVHPHRRRTVARAARGARRRGIRRGSPPGVSPVQFLDDSGFLDARVLAVHGVQMTPADLARLAARGATLVTCPRSNGHTGAGAPPIEDFYDVRRARRGRHRQPGERAGPERLRRAGDDARAGAVGAGVARCSTARRGRARGRSASTPTTARSSRASARGCWPCTFRPASTMWKNTWCRDRAGADPLDRVGAVRIADRCML